jgi:hypothetical protein
MVRIISGLRVLGELDKRNNESGSLVPYGRASTVQTVSMLCGINGDE